MNLLTSMREAVALRLVAWAAGIAPDHCKEEIAQPLRNLTYKLILSRQQQGENGSNGTSDSSLPSG